MFADDGPHLALSLEVDRLLLEVQGFDPLLNLGVFSWSGKIEIDLVELPELHHVLEVKLPALVLGLHPLL